MFAIPGKVPPLQNHFLITFYFIYLKCEIIFLGIFAPSTKITKEASQPQSISQPSSLPTPTARQTPNQSSQAASLPNSRTSGPSSRNHSRSSSPHDSNEAEIAERFEVCTDMLMSEQSLVVKHASEANFTPFLLNHVGLEINAFCSLTFQLNDRVVVAGQKSGRVQYIGQTQFASGYVDFRCSNRHCAS